MSGERCPVDSGGAFLDRHIMHLEKSAGDRELWKCVKCGFTRIEGREARCKGCGGFCHERAPSWCWSKEKHTT